MQDQIFKGLKVVELAGVLAGPSVGMFFAELGADVIKVENKATGGDMTRKWKVPGESPTDPLSAYYSSVNFFKKVVFANLKEDIDQRWILDEIQSADIVIVNFKPGSAERIGMDYSSLSRINPKLIYASVEGLGRGDLRPAFDVVLQAETGYISMTGNEGESFSKMPVALIDLLAAHQLKQGILMALIRRGTSGKGCCVKVSLLKAGLASLANQATNWLMANHLPGRMGTRHPNIAPYGDSFTTLDGRNFVLAVGTEKQWADLCDLLELSEELRGMNNLERVKNRVELVSACDQRFRDFSSKELFPRLISANVPYGEILKLDEVLSSSVAREMILEEEQEGVLKRGLRSVAFEIFENGGKDLNYRGK
ncbi:MAG: CoA transferase [Saprospirales bacterium]|nr:MAG: CoA transferase [Saprospirales bacterium]